MLNTLACLTFGKIVLINIACSLVGMVIGFIAATLAYQKHWEKYKGTLICSMQELEGENAQTTHKT